MDQQPRGLVLLPKIGAPIALIASLVSPKCLEPISTVDKDRRVTRTNYLWV